MDAVHLSLALGPLALYLIVLGGLNLTRRSFLVSGARDFILLAMALSGFVIVGPMQLFLPEAAAVHFGPYVWLLLLSFYGLCVTLYVLLARPRLILYNQSMDGLRPVLAEVVGRLDPEARWAGDSIVMPQLGVQMHLDQCLPMRNVSLVAIGENQSFSGWRRLETELARALREVEVRPNPRGFSLLAIGLLMIGYPAWQVVIERHQVAQTFLDLLRL